MSLCSNNRSSQEWARDKYTLIVPAGLSILLPLRFSDSTPLKRMRLGIRNSTRGWVALGVLKKRNLGQLGDSVPWEKATDMILRIRMFQILFCFVLFFFLNFRTFAYTKLRILEIRSMSQYEINYTSCTSILKVI